jgi:hypothetical protein
VANRDDRGRWEALSREEQEILLARRRTIASLHFDILYERLPKEVKPLEGIK